jgi:tetratricopeptide (TPR) repeat protein
LIAAGVVLGCTIGWTAGCSTSQEDDQAAAKVRWEDARARVFESLARDQFEAGQLAESRDTCNQSLAISMRNVSSLLLSARIDLERNDLKAAKQTLATARLLDPEPIAAAEIDHLDGVIAERWQDQPGALAFHESAATLQPDNPAYLIAYAESLTADGRADEARQALEARVTFFEGDAAVRDALGQVLRVLGHEREAVHYFSQAAVLAPDDASIRERLAMACLAAGDFGRAAHLLGNLIQSDERKESASLHLALGEAELRRQRPDEAIPAFQTAARLDGQSLAAWIGIAKASLDTAELSRAQAALRRADAIDAGHPEAGLLRGYLQLRQGRHDEAATTFARVARRMPADPVPLVMRALCLQATGRFSEAERELERALQLDPRDPLALALADRNDQLRRGMTRTDTDPID